MNFDQIKWCVEQHEKTNHYYDNYLPYEYHLRMVAQVAKENIHLVKDEELKGCCVISAFAHDLIEDTRVSYNDVSGQLGQKVADIVYAVTNEKGKNRKERANDKYYEGIRNTPGSVFVKLCDRIANVQYSKLTKSRMFEMYKKENEQFMINLGYNGSPSCEYFDMFYYLNKLFKDE